MGKTVKNGILTVLILALFIGLLCLLTRLLQPKYMDDLTEGSMISQYYRYAGGHDVIFIGDCEVYANFTPMELYREAGITAYVRGTPQQLIWQSYYVLRDTLRYETPRAVVLNVNAMRYDAPVSEEYNRLTIDGMRWSMDKVGIIQASMTEDEDFLSYVFPILRYHARFDKLTEEDFTYLFQVKDTTWNGHLINQAVNPMGTLPVKKPLPSYTFSDVCYDYLDKIRTLCAENGIELILIKAPSAYPYWYDEYDVQMEDYAEKYGLSFYNCLDYVGTVGISYETDTYDGGLHMNLAGATKLSRWFAGVLAENHGIPDHRNDPQTSAVYDDMLRQYDLEIQTEESK